MFDYSQTDIANGADISKNQISKYISGQYLPTLKNAIKLSKFFDCSLDYLFGIEDIPNKYNSPLLEPKLNVFLERVEKLTEGKALLKICKENDLTRNSFYEWKNKKTFPTMENLIKLALTFNVSIEFLIGRTDDKTRRNI